ncbi:hypothetical protein [Sulfurospirillum sp.]|jgi:hypothetical protein|uniref:hypothetical protein n=1 Tax=Sulfurospirillum sp. TaxID=2053622 RepID=UPI002FDDEE32
MFKRLTLLMAMVAFLSTSVFAQSYLSSEDAAPKHKTAKTKTVKKTTKKSTSKQHTAAKKSKKKASKVAA